MNEANKQSLKELSASLGGTDYITGQPVPLTSAVYVAWRNPDGTLKTEMLFSSHSWNSYGAQVVSTLGEPDMMLDGSEFRRVPGTPPAPKKKVVKLDPYYRVSLVKKPKDNIVLFGILK
jgi:hypothetical protein